jgi:hypothetical protein
VESDAELACPLAADVGNPLPNTSALADWNILTEDQADALWPLVDVASDSLASLTRSSVAGDPPDSAGEQ